MDKRIQIRKVMYKERLAKIPSWNAPKEEQKDVLGFFKDYELGKITNRIPLEETLESYVLFLKIALEFLKKPVKELTEKDIEVKVENNVLSISSKKEEVKENKDKDYVHKERRSYSFSRSFTLPDNVKSDKIDASFNNGLLNISIPKAPEAKPKLIEVKVK